MDDALLVRGFERVDDLLRVRDGLVNRNRAAREPRGKVVALDELERERQHAVGLFEPVNGRDMRMIQRGEHLRFAAKPGHAVGIQRERRRQHLDRRVAIEPGVVGAIDLAHPARADGGDDLVRANAGPRGQCHRAAPRSLDPDDRLARQRKCVERCDVR